MKPTHFSVTFEAELGVLGDQILGAMQQLCAKLKGRERWFYFRYYEREKSPLIRIEAIPR